MLSFTKPLTTFEKLLCVSKAENESVEEITVIVKFTDKETAKEFARNVDTYDRKDESMTKRVGFIFEPLMSLSSALCYILILLLVLGYAII